MKTYTITFNEEQLDDLKNALFIYGCECIRDNYLRMYAATENLMKYIELAVQ